MNDTPKMIREDVAFAMVAAEREANAREAEEHNDDMWEYSTGNRAPIVGMRDPIAHAIRARTPDDAKAALNALLKAEREKALREAPAHLAMDFNAMEYLCFRLEVTREELHSALRAIAEKLTRHALIEQEPKE